MENISVNGESIKLKMNDTYYFIDALYIMDIKQSIDTLDTFDLEKQLREKVFAFPCTDIPFAKYYSDSNIFNIERITKVYYNDIQTKNNSYFSTDTGLIIVIKDDLILNFSNKFDYDELLESEVHLLNLSYWHELAITYDFNDLGLILSPGTQTGFDLQGSGTYQIK